MNEEQAKKYLEIQQEILHKFTLAEVMHIAISIIFGLCFIGLLVLAMID